MVTASQPVIRAVGPYEGETGSRPVEGLAEQERQVEALLAEAQAVIDRLRNGLDAARHREARAEEEYATRVGDDEVVATQVLSAAHALAGSIVGHARRDAEALLVAAEAKAREIDREGQDVLRRVQAQVQQALVDCRSTERQQIQIALRDSRARPTSSPGAVGPTEPETAVEPEIEPEPEREPEYEMEPDLEPVPTTRVPLSVLADTFKRRMTVAASRADAPAADEEWFAELRRAVGQEQSLTGDRGGDTEDQQADEFRPATRS